MTDIGILQATADQYRKEITAFQSNIKFVTDAAAANAARFAVSLAEKQNALDGLNAQIDALNNLAS